MAEALSDPARFDAVLRRGEHDVTVLAAQADAGRIQPTPETFALVLRHTAGLLAALRACVVLGSS